MLPLIDSQEDARSSVQLTLAARVGLRLPNVEDDDLLRQWFELSDVESSWGAPEQNLAFVAQLRAAPGHGDAGNRVIVVENEPVGYVRWHRAPIDRLRNTPLFERLGAAATRVDVLVGPRERRFIGIGSVALRHVREELTLGFGPRSVWGLAGIAQLAARRAFEKAGFRHHYFYDDAQLGPAVAMVRPAS
ncbi:MAG: GNAT family N-acetyltransferase [Polyangiaceae bacterium]